MTTDTVGGVWRYSLELAAALQPHGTRVCLAAMGGAPSAAQRREAAALDNVELLGSDWALEWMQDPWDDVDRAGRWLLDLESRIRPDIVQINGFAHAALPFAAPVVLVAHSCVCSWWRAVWGGAVPARFDTYRRRVTDGLERAREIIAPTRAILEAIFDCYPVPARGRVIANGCAPGRSASGRKEALILSAGRTWDPAKNLTLLDACAGRLAWPVAVAGPVRSPDGERTRTQHVRLLGALGRRELDRWMERAAIYTLPARYEPFGLSILEAAQAGCALVIGDIPTLRELWDDAAVFVSPEDHEALSAALLELSRDWSLRQRLVARSVRRACHYGAGQMGAAYAAVYEQLIAPVAAPADPRREGTGV
jgi:glycogen(starch) synthase